MEEVLLPSEIITHGQMVKLFAILFSFLSSLLRIDLLTLGFRGYPLEVRKGRIVLVTVSVRRRGVYMTA